MREDHRRLLGVIALTYLGLVALQLLLVALGYDLNRVFADPGETFRHFGDAKNTDGALTALTVVLLLAPSALAAFAWTTTRDRTIGGTSDRRSLVLALALVLALLAVDEQLRLHESISGSFNVPEWTVFVPTALLLVGSLWRWRRATPPVAAPLSVAAVSLGLAVLDDEFWLWHGPNDSSIVEENLELLGVVGLAVAVTELARLTVIEPADSEADLTS